MRKNKVPNKETLIRIIKRKCSPKVQPHIIEGNVYVVLGHDCKGKRKTLLVAKGDDIKHTWRVSDCRFDWEIVSTEQALRQYKRSLDESARQLTLARFSEEHLAQIYFHPAIMVSLVHRYAELVIKEAAYNKLPQFKAISRQIKSIIVENDKFIYQSLGTEAYKIFSQQMEDMYNDNIRDFTVLFYSMNNIVKRHLPDDPYDTIRTNAIIAIMLCDMYKAHIKNVCGLIEEMMPEATHKPDLVSKDMQQIRFLLGAFVSKDGNININDESIHLNKQIVHKIIQRVDSAPYMRAMV